MADVAAALKGLARFRLWMGMLIGDGESPTGPRWLRGSSADATEIEVLRLPPPIAPGLRGRLESQKAVCRSQDTRLLTPHVILALLSDPTGFAEAAFDSAAAGAAADLRRQLLPFRSTDPFEDFDWGDRTELQEAAVRMAGDGEDEIRDRHVLLAILEGESGSRRSIEGWLGEDLFATLVTNVRAARGPRFEASVTPPLDLGSTHAG
jgi:hypothetical protein